MINVLLKKLNAQRNAWTNLDLPNATTMGLYTGYTPIAETAQKLKNMRTKFLTMSARYLVLVIMISQRCVIMNSFSKL